MTIRKIINFLKTELAYLFKRPRLASYPYELIVESTNICQLKCPFCYSSKPDTKLEKGFMEFELFVFKRNLATVPDIAYKNIANNM